MDPRFARLEPKCPLSSPKSTRNDEDGSSKTPQKRPQTGGLSYRKSRDLPQKSVKERKVALLVKTVKTPIKTNLFRTEMTRMDPRSINREIKAFSKKRAGMSKTRFSTRNAHFSPRNCSQNDEDGPSQPLQFDEDGPS